jgi:hypothetical protein
MKRLLLAAAAIAFAAPALIRDLLGGGGFDRPGE